MKSKVLLIVLVFLSLQNMAGTLNLDDLKSKAESNHYGLKARVNTLKAAGSTVDSMKANYYPQVGIQAGNEWLNYDGGDDSDKLVSIYAQMNLLNGFRDERSINKLKINNDLLESRMNNFKWSLGLLIEEKYYGYLFVKKKLEINSDHISRVNKHLELVKKRYNSKLITETDYLQFQLHYKKLLSANNYLKLEHDQLLSEITLMVGEESSEKVVIDGEIPHLHVKNALSDLLKQIEDTPLIKQLKLQEGVADLNKKIAASGWLPAINLRAEHGKLDEVETGIDSELTSSRVVLMANWEFFSGFKTERQIEQAEFNKNSIQFKKLQSQRDFKVLVTKNFQKLKMLEETIDLEEENQKIAKKLYVKTLSEYRRGVKDASALGEASESLASSAIRIFELKTNHLMTKLELEKALGRSVEFENIHHKGHH